MRASDVVPVGIDILGQVEQILCGPRDLARPHGVGHAPHDPYEPQASTGARTAAASTPSFASSSWRPAKATAGDEQRDGEADPGDGPGGAQHRPADRRSEAAEGGTRREVGGREDAGGLPDHVAEEDSEAHRRARARAEHRAVEADACVGQREQRHDHDSCSKGAGCTEDARSARSPTARRAGRCGRDPVWAARGRSA